MRQEPADGPDNDIPGDRSSGGDRGDRPRPGDVEKRPDRLDDEDAHAAFRAGELPTMAPSTAAGAAICSPAMR